MTDATAPTTPRAEALKLVHFGAVIRAEDGHIISYGTLCGLEGDCRNRDPEATTCKACKRSRGWEFAVTSLRERHQ